MRTHRNALSAPAQRKLDAVLRREPPKLLAEVEYIAARGDEERTNFRVLRRLIRQHLPALEEQTGIDASYWHVWTKDGIVLTKIGSTVPVTSAIEHDTEEDEEARERAIGGEVAARTQGVTRRERHRKPRRRWIAIRGDGKRLPPSRPTPRRCGSDRPSLGP